MHLKHKKEAPMAGLSRRERGIIDSFFASDKSAITAEDLIRILPMPRFKANQILTRLQHKGWLNRIKRGVYVTVPLGSSSSQPALSDAWPLTMTLFNPCFISGWSAAEHWNLTEQISNTVSIVTTSKQRHKQQSLSGVTFLTRTVQQQRFFGAKELWFGSQKIKIASPERMVIDLLDDPDFGGGARQSLDVVQAYWKSKHVNAALLLEYAERFDRGTVFKRLGFTAELFGKVDEKWLNLCHKGISKGISNLDPNGPNSGKISSRWNLRINLPIDQ